MTQRAPSRRFVCLLLPLLACSTSHLPPTAGPRPKGPVLSYSIPSLTGQPIDSNTHRGRATALLFITTFDVFSQAEAARLEDLFRSHEPRINAAAVIMEPPKNLELAQAFVNVLHLSYPVGMADQRELSRQGVLGEIATVPAWLFLDPKGHLVATGLGSLSLSELKSAVDQAQR